MCTSLFTWIFMWCILDRTRSLFRNRNRQRWVGKTPIIFRALDDFLFIFLDLDFFLCSHCLKLYSNKAHMPNTAILFNVFHVEQNDYLEKLLSMIHWEKPISDLLEKLYKVKENTYYAGTCTYFFCWGGKGLVRNVAATP